MKKSFITILMSAMIVSTAGCGAMNNTANPSSGETSTETESSFIRNITTADVTSDYLTKATTPSEILKAGSFAVNKYYENTGDAILEGSNIKTTFAMKGDIYEVSECTTYGDGYVTNTYFSTDENDKTYYMSYPSGVETSDLEDGFATEYINSSISGYSADVLEVSEVKEVGDTIEATVLYKSSGEVASTENITLDKESGRISKIVSTYASAKSDENSVCTMDFDYSENVAIDYTAKETATGSDEKGSTSEDAATEDSAAENTSAEDTTVYSGDLDLNTEDINSNPVNNDLFKGAKLVLINLWEPWCGPCVGELPDLQKLYENYKDKGLVVIGAYQSTDMQSEAEEIISSKGITYPILKNNDWLDSMEQSYVPASYLADGEGNLISKKAIAGAKSYEEWEALIKPYLE